MWVCSFCGDSARAERMTTECVPSYGGAHEE
jgi:ribosomal protein L32